MFCHGDNRKRREKAMKRLIFSLLLVVSSVVGAGALTVASGSIAVHATIDPVNVYVGYADNSRLNPTHFPTPWYGDAGVTSFEGCHPADCNYDSGAVRVVNTTAQDETLNEVIVRIDGDNCKLDLWTHDISLPAGGQVIFTQNVQAAASGCQSDGSFDSSDISSGGQPTTGCTPDGLQPTVEVKVTQGVNVTDKTYTDTAQVLNTGGVDLANCPSGSNESLQWQLIGGNVCAGASTLTLAPSTQIDATGSNATVTATFANDCNPPQPLQGATVTFTVLPGSRNAGVNGTGTSPTDANGQASFTYSSSLLGTDTVEASITNAGGTITSNDVVVQWVTFGGVTSGHFNDPANVSATFKDAGGNPIMGGVVAFSLASAPGAKCVTKTDATGLAQCQVTPRSPAGPDTLIITLQTGSPQAPITGQRPFLVTLEDAALWTAGTLQVTTAGKPVTLLAKLTDPRTAGETGPVAPIANKRVTIKLGSGGGALSCNGVTDSTGYARCSVTPGAGLLGSQPVSASFPGDAFYEAAST
jgi:hypothetical protein